VSSRTLNFFLWVLTLIHERPIYLANHDSSYHTLTSTPFRPPTYLHKMPPFHSIPIGPASAAGRLRPNGFIERAPSTAHNFTSSRKRASDKALAFLDSSGLPTNQDFAVRRGAGRNSHRMK
jgi:hypothetical protein